MVLFLCLFVLFQYRAMTGSKTRVLHRIFYKLCLDSFHPQVCQKILVQISDEERAKEEVQPHS